MSQHRLIARLSRLEASIPPRTCKNKDSLPFSSLTRRELLHLMTLQESSDAGDQTGAIEAYLNTIRERACMRREALYAEDIQALLGREWMLGDIEDLPKRYPGFEAPDFPLLEPFLRRAARIENSIRWENLFPESQSSFSASKPPEL